MAGRALVLLSRRFFRGYEVHSLSQAADQVRDGFRNLTTPDDLLVCSACGEPKTANFLGVYDASQMYEQVSPKRAMSTADRLIRSGAHVKMIGVTLVQSVRLHGWTNRRLRDRADAAMVYFSELRRLLSLCLGCKLIRVGP